MECTGDRHCKQEECTGDRHYTYNHLLFIKPVLSTCMHRECTETDITHNKEMEKLTFKRWKVNFNLGDYTHDSGGFDLDSWQRIHLEFEGQFSRWLRE